MSCCRSRAWGRPALPDGLAEARLMICGKCPHLSKAKKRGSRSQLWCEKCDCLVEDLAKDSHCPITKW